MEQDRYIKEKYIKHLKKQEKYGKIAMFENSIAILILTHIRAYGL